MKNNNTTWLQFCGYGEYGICEVTDFEVNTEWLKSVIEEPLSEFLETYTSDESEPIYDMAILKGKLLNESKSE